MHRILGVVLIVLVTASASASATEIKVWPLFRYHHDAGAHTLRLDLLGPLLTYERNAGGRLFALRPLFLWQTQSAPQRRRMAFLYPFATARWSDERSMFRLLGVFTSERHQTHVAGNESNERRVTLFPLVFYRSSKTSGRSLSILPFYANLTDFFGYERIRMLLFPLYLSLSEPLQERRWLAFPFFSQTRGTQARGWRLWPLYGWHEEGRRHFFRYVLWPFYIHEERHAGRPEAEVLDVWTPFYVRTDGKRLTSRLYGLFFSHSIDHKSRRETWGAPWPLWLYQRDLDSGRRTSIRLVPFYQDRERPGGFSRFYLWPLYRTREEKSDGQFFRRRDFLLVVGRSIERSSVAPPSSQTLFTMLPLWRRTERNGTGRMDVPALLDALFPEDEIVRLLYAPLWRVYSRRWDDRESLHWNFLWGFLTSGKGKWRFPVTIDLHRETPTESTRAGHAKQR